MERECGASISPCVSPEGVSQEAAEGFGTAKEGSTSPKAPEENVPVATVEEDRALDAAADPVEVNLNEECEEGILEDLAAQTAGQAKGQRGIYKPF